MMKVIVISIKEYFKEASIHGFKYLGQESSIISKLFWLAAVSCCFTAAYQSFKMAMIDWDTTPLVTTIESFDIPSEPFQFPTITVCTKDIAALNVELSRHLINGLEFSCDDESGQSDCSRSQAAREVIAPLTKKYLTDLESKYRSEISYDSCNLLLYSALKDNISSVEDMETRLSSSVGMAGGVEKFVTWLKTQLPNISPNDMHPHDERCKEANAVYEMMNRMKLMEKPNLGDLIWAALKPYEKNVDASSPDALISDIKFLESIIPSLLNGIRLSDDQQLVDCKDYINSHIILHNLAYPCGLEKCCGMGISRTTEALLGQLMSITKLNLPHSGYELSPEYLMNKLNLTGTLAGFSVKSLVGSKARFVWNHNSIIPTCSFGKVDDDSVSEADCDLLSPAPTNMGICYAFNADIGWSPKKSKNFDSAFRYAFEAELEGPRRKKQIYDAEKGKSLVFVHSRNRESFGSNTYNSDFILKVSDKHSFFNIHSEVFKIEPGYRKTITVRPVVKRSYGIEHLPLSKRKCRFSHEVIDDDYSIFDFYSMDSCVQECRVAFSIETCRCIPLFMPFNDNYDLPEFPVCLNFGYKCFYAMAHNTSIDDLPFCRDRCISSCNTIKFEITQQESQPLDEMDCYDTSSNKLTIRSLRQKYRQIGNLIYLKRKSKQIDYADGASAQFIDWCWATHSSDLAVVEVKVDFSSLIQYRQTERVDLIGKISNLGGILGLFTGMSFLSLVEAAFWTIKSAVAGSIQRMREPILPK